MHIIVTCPNCQRKYQLNPELRGKRIRCPNPACREIIEIKEAEEPESLPALEAPGILPDESIDIVPIPEEKKYVPPKRPGRESSATPVAEMVPILPPEKETPEPPASRYQPPPRKLNLDDLVKLEVPDYSPPSSKPKSPPSRHDKERKKRRHRDYPVSQPVAPPPSPSRTEPPVRPSPVSPPKPSGESEGPSWQNAPPPVREGKSERDTLVANRNEFFAEAAPVAPGDLFEGAQPVAETPPSEEGSPYQTGDSYESEEADGYPQTSGRRRARWIILTMLVLVASVAGAGGWIVYRSAAATEEKRAKQAEQEYDDGNYAAAADHYAALAKDFPKSDNADFYQFLADLSEVRNQVHQTGSDPIMAFELLSGFARGQAGSPILQEYGKDVWQSYRKSIEDLTALSEQNLSPPAHFQDARRLLKAARKASREAKNFADKNGGHEETNQKFLARFDELERDITKLEEQSQAVAKIKTFQPTPEDIWEAERLIRKFNLQQEKEITELVAGLKAKMISEVGYEPAKAQPPKVEGESRQSGLLVAPAVGARTAPPTGGGVVFALARGVLYALAETDGKVLWATRVGIDTYHLPVRVVASENVPEMVLIPSSETNILTAREVATGKPLWRYDLKAACPGRPVLVGRRVYVPTLEGKVHELELADGRLVGWYKLGLPLSVSGSRQEGGNLVYLPADSFNVYILDVAQQKCVGILQSGHPSGSLRGAPILVGGRDSPEPKYLVLIQADGLTAMKLRAFPLPIAGISTVPAVQPEPRIRGWSWFQPHYDGEKIVLATDAGAIGLFGVQQPGNEDKPIFHELHQDVSPGERLTQPARSQVVAVADDDFWLEANGNLQLMHFDLFGQRIVPLWNRPVPLGTPLHAAQVDEKTKTIVTVTQSLPRQACLATAVSAVDGLIRWQRQLGLDCKGDPVALGQEVVALDQGGTLFRFDSDSLNKSQEPNSKNQIPRTNGMSEFGSLLLDQGGQIVGGSLESTDNGPYLLTSPDGRSVVEVACVEKKTAEGERRFDLVVRHYEPGKNLAENTIPLKTARLYGTPGIAGGNLLVPLDNGTLLRLSADGKHSDFGPGWRGRNSDPAARGQVIVLGPEEFLTGDGSRNLNRWRWPAGGKTYQDEKKVDLPNPIVSQPVIWRGETGKEAPSVCLADTGKTVRLLNSSDLQKVRHWLMPGKITAGPFVRGKHIGCVVDQRRLVWIDPAQEKPVWEYQSVGDGIVGEPRIISGTIVVADVNGRFVGLDPATGKSRWQSSLTGHRSADPEAAAAAPGSNLAPTATPTEFGPDRAFVPLTDGTVFLLSLKNQEPNSKNQEPDSKNQTP